MDEHLKKDNEPVRLAVFASGAGSNALKIIQYFKNNPGISISLIVCNKQGAGVLQIAENQGIETLMLEKERFFRGDGFVTDLKERKIDFIILAGFLWKIPVSLIQAFPSRIINIHPALLPKYGGKGMYGAFVHEAVLNAEEKESGITIHLVDEQYDHGDHLFQVSIPVLPDDTAESLANRIHNLEHQHYPVQIEKFIKMSTAG
ncbi:phosphoribosylglycinamide formyltransferase [Pollutibacter soli]|uniref:phosphoribosylglycinamide formyltransferase n=1 Tax=Pollutibacter soli TaxID=3034157 RepID=UPI00301325B8